MKTELKLLSFVALLWVWWLFGGFGNSKEGYLGRLHGAMTALYIVGAITALTEGEDPIGDLQPISLRPIFVAFGALLMIAAFVAMISTRHERDQKVRPNLTLEPTRTGKLGLPRVSRCSCVFRPRVSGFDR
jgi:hypothetical protein